MSSRNNPRVVEMSSIHYLGIDVPKSKTRVRVDGSSNGVLLIMEHCPDPASLTLAMIHISNHDGAFFSAPEIYVDEKAPPSRPLETWDPIIDLHEGPIVASPIGQIAPCRPQMET